MGCGIFAEVPQHPGCGSCTSSGAGGARLNDGVVAKFVRAALAGDTVRICGDGTQRVYLAHMREVLEAVKGAIRKQA